MWCLSLPGLKGPGYLQRQAVAEQRQSIRLFLIPCTDFHARTSALPPCCPPLCRPSFPFDLRLDFRRLLGYTCAVYKQVSTGERRAILSVGLQVGLRRAEIARLKVSDFHVNRGFDSLKVVRKGGKKGSLAIHPHTAQRIRDYMAKAGNENDKGAPLFLPVRGNQRSTDERRHLHPDEINRIVRKYAKRIGLERGYSAHSMRATFITTALDNGASLEDVQRAAGHADPATTKLYDRRGYNPEKSASFFASY